MSVTVHPANDQGRHEAHRIAQTWAARGIPVFPIAIGWDPAKYGGAGGTTKRPLTVNGHRDATLDPTMLDQLYTAAQPRPGELIATGIVPGPAGYLALDIDNKSGVNGYVCADTLDLPDTYTVRTPSGGEHRYYQKVELERPVGNASPWAERGIDIRADDGWTVAPGTRTPWGTWARVDDQTLWPNDVTTCPRHVWAQLPNTRTSSSTGSGSGTAHNPLTPALRAALHPATLEALNTLEQHYGAHTPTWHTADGRTWIHVAGPHKRPGEVSASIGRINDGIIWNFSSTWTQTHALPYETPARVHDGRVVTVTEWETAQLDGWDTPPAAAEGDGGTPRLSQLIDNDIAAYLNGTIEPETTSLHPIGNKHLLYRNRANVIYGESGIGKTWLTYSIAAHHLTQTDGSTIILDWEDTTLNLIQRLTALDVPHTLLANRQRLRHITVATRLGEDELAHAHQIANELDGHTIIIFDALADALSLDGANENHNEEVTPWHHHVISPLLRAGHTVLLIDHQTTKLDSTDQKRGARGASAKLALIDGAVYETRSVTSFSKDQPGELKLIVAKDRHGSVGAVKTVAAHVYATPSNGRLYLRWGTPETARPTRVMETISRWLEIHKHVTTSQKQVEEGVSGRAVTIRAALDLLVDNGHVAVENGPRGKLNYKSLRPYREADEWSPEDES